MDAPKNNYQIQCAGGYVFGVFSAYTVKGALLALARQEGFSSFEAMQEERRIIGYTFDGVFRIILK